jgi:hypothetical protein
MKNLSYLKVPFVAATMIIALGTNAAAQRLPWKHGDKPPSLAGFYLHEEQTSARAKLGSNVTADTLGDRSDPAIAITSQERGVSLVASRLDGVAIIYVTRRDAGVLDSIRVGDTRDRVLARWGPPSRIDGSNALWLVDDWVVIVELGDGNRIARLGVGRQG